MPSTVRTNLCDIFLQLLACYSKTNGIRAQRRIHETPSLFHMVLPGKQSAVTVPRVCQHSFDLNRLVEGLGTKGRDVRKKGDGNLGTYPQREILLFRPNSRYIVGGFSNLR